MNTINQLLKQASEHLQREGIEHARHDAEMLLLHEMKWTRTELLFHLNGPLGDDARKRWQHLLEQRAARVPLQHIIGAQSFYGLRFRVTADVLIPRPETELLVDELLKLLDDRPLRVADIGTGSGAIAIALKARRPQWHVIACDLSPQALAIARANQQQATGAITLDGFMQGDLLAPLIEAEQSIDLLVSNPPYIPTNDLQRLQAEVRDHEPHLALDGGPDGLISYRRIVSQLEQLPKFPRVLAFEHGIGQSEAIVELLQGVSDYNEFKIIEDYNGIKRHIIALQPSKLAARSAQ